MGNLPDELELFEAAVDRFCEQPVPEGGPELATFLKRLQRAGDRISLKVSEAAAAFASTDHYEEQGFVSPIHWIRANCHLTAGAAADRVAVGEQLRSVPESHQSMVEGEIGFARLAHIARTVAAIEETGSNKPFDETPLLDKARELSVGRFIDFCHHMRHAADPEGYAAAEAQGVSERASTPQDIIWCTGSKAARRTCRTWCCSVIAITGWSTRGSGS